MKRLLAALIVGLLSTAGGHAAEFETRASPPAPALQARDLTGATKTLADYRGKVLLLNYWASWCPPCLREMPSLVRLRASMAGRPLEIVAIGSAESSEEVNAYLSKMKLGFSVLLDENGSNTQRWKVFALPTTFLLDGEGRVRYVLKGATEWDDAEALRVIESLLTEVPASASK